VAGAISFQIELGGRVNHFYLAAFVGYLAGVHPKPWPGPDCGECDPDSLSRHFTEWQFGLNGIWHFRPGAQWDPWLGGSLGFGLGTDGIGPLLGVELGVYYRVSAGFAFGPYAALTGTSMSSEYADLWHEWLTFGLRMTVLDRSPKDPVALPPAAPEGTNGPLP
jgi:hypothetical protein